MLVLVNLDHLFAWLLRAVELSRLPKFVGRCAAGLIWIKRQALMLVSLGKNRANCHCEILRKAGGEEDGVCDASSDVEEDADIGFGVE